MSDYQPDASTAREDVCRFLAACYYEPTPEFAQAHMFESLVIAASALGPAWQVHAAELKKAFEEESIETLLIDYTRLFMGPIDTLAPPYGSSWQKQDNPTEENPPPAVLELYDAGGFEIDEVFMELPDHVAVELEFLYALIFKANLAAREDNALDLAQVQQLKQRLIVEHLGDWVVPFTKAMAQGAQTRFYRELAAFTAFYVAHVDAPLVLH